MAEETKKPAKEKVEEKKEKITKEALEEAKKKLEARLESKGKSAKIPTACPACGGPVEKDRSALDPLCVPGHLPRRHQDLSRRASASCPIRSFPPS